MSLFSFFVVYVLPLPRFYLLVKMRADVNIQVLTYRWCMRAGEFPLVLKRVVVVIEEEGAEDEI